MKISKKERDEAILWLEPAADSWISQGIARTGYEAPRGVARQGRDAAMATGC